ncbi:hypothetical protein [Oceanobacillus profundus]|uniref:hypothetical protein n=1 Tax=Oceanobacillus TaxID=182709 RepID=UPI0013144A66|nr:hypothetical protein [Oceanobacillus profundus]MBR3120564.1 hypothetical protein [Oceanobacillus sp.]MCM3397706.1 hypothetical protein [Oceanobacillus profundus]MDO6451449.1 hypothetical protein [Oceanobacillus profundus]
MEAILDYQKKQKVKKAQSKLTFKQWVLKSVKTQKKRTSMDSMMGLIITAIVFLITLV